MFIPQLLKLIDKLFNMTEQEMRLIQMMQIKKATHIAKEREHLVQLYHGCLFKIENDQNIQQQLKHSDEAHRIKQEILRLSDLLSRYDRILKRVERSKATFLQNTQKSFMHKDHKVKRYDKEGYISDDFKPFIKQKLDNIKYDSL